mmetsp:Transcript_38865/g.116848  ORF Transcript_38865/g.116848 Transcript_38865/m.116848 type:complete len:105 (-) Transcript_38865:23-337(-)
MPVLRSQIHFNTVTALITNHSLFHTLFASTREDCLLSSSRVDCWVYSSSSFGAFVVGLLGSGCFVMTLQHDQGDSNILSPSPPYAAVVVSSRASRRACAPILSL